MTGNGGVARRRWSIPILVPLALVVWVLMYLDEIFAILIRWGFAR
jgi:hypothetical protein